MRGTGRMKAGAKAPRESQRGHLMAGLMVGVAIMMIFSTVAFQAWSDVLRRDNEAEMMFRAQDIVRAIQRYRRDHGGSGPLKLELLMEPGPKGQYYLRRLYEDPLVPDGKWGLLHLGPGGQIIDPNAKADDTGLGGPASGLGGLGSLGGLNQPGSSLGTGLSGAGPEQGAGAATRSRARGQQGGLNRQGLPNSPLNPNDPSQLEGLPIIGVKTLCDETPFRVYNGLSSYDQWLFTYFDLDARQVPGGAGGQQQGRRPGLAGGQPGAGRQGAGQQPGLGNQGQDTVPRQPRRPNQPQVRE